MALISLALMLAAGSFLGQDSRRLVLIFMFSGYVELWISSSKITYFSVIKSNLLSRYFIKLQCL